MQLLDQIRRTAEVAAAGGGPSFLIPNADPRWRPAPDAATGALRVDPEFSLPTAAGMLTWALFYDSSRADADGEYGFGRCGAFPLRLVNDTVSGTVTVMHEDGALRTYRLSGTDYVADPQNGDRLTLTAGVWKETLAASGLEYNFPDDTPATLSYRATPQGQRLTYSYTAAADGTLETVTVQDPAGRRVTLTCNGDGRVQTVEDWGGRGLMVLTYDGNGDLTELWEQEGVLTRYGYDSSHRLTYILDPAGFVTTYEYDHITGQVISRSVDGSRGQYDYSTPGATGYIDPLGYRWTHLVDDAGYPAGMIDPLGNESIYTYNNDRPVAFKNPLGQSVTFSYDLNGYMLSRQDELGHRTTFVQDGNGNVVSVVDALNQITNLDYGASPTLRQLATVTDPLGNQTNFGYDSYGFPHYIQDAAGYRTTLNWTNLGVLASVQNARGFVWTYAYDTAANRLSTLDPLGNRWSYTYDQRGRLVGEQTPLGDRWSTVYDTRDMVQALVDPLGNRTTLTWNAQSGLTAIIDSAGSRWTGVYDAANQNTASVDPLGNRTTYGYDTARRLTVIQDALGKRTTLGYDAANRLIDTVDPLGFRTTYSYDATGRPVSVQNARGYITTYSSDAVGQLRSITNALGYVSTIDYDAAGRPTVLHDPLGNLTTLQYDARGLVSVTIDSLGKRTTFSYTPTGRPESITDPRGKVWTSVYDEWDRLQAVVDPLAHRATLIYDPAGRVSALWDARGFRWTTLYDARNLPVGSIDPLGRRATYSFDSLGQLVTFTDQKSQLATFSYSKRYEITTAIYADGTRMTYSYDSVGQLATLVDSSGLYTLTYNDRGELTNVRAPQHPSGGILTYGYDEVGNRTLINSWIARQTMAYDALDRCVSAIYDTDGKITTWMYDGLDRPTTQLNWNNTRTTWGYDARGLLSLIRHTKTDDTLLELASYSYDDAGNPLIRTTNAGTTTWTYDDASQLLSEQHSSGTIDTWTYDPAGNRLTRSRTVGGVTTVATSTYDQAGQLTTLIAGTALTTFAYELNGNLQSENTAPTGVTTYSWDGLDRLTAVIPPSGSRSTYTYRYDNLRSSQNLGAGMQTLVWDVQRVTGFGHLLEELDGTSSLLRAYFRALDLATQRDQSGSYAFHWMDQGTAQILTDATGAAAQNYQFSAWGEQLGAPGAATTPLAWNGNWGYYQDPGTTARNWVRERHLDVLRGRWLSQDPVGFQGSNSVLRPADRLVPVGATAAADQLNLYLYCANSPLGSVDPSGLAKVILWVRNLGNTIPKDPWGIHWYAYYFVPKHSFITVVESNSTGPGLRLPPQFVAMKHPVSASDYLKTMTVKIGPYNTRCQEYYNTYHTGYILADDDRPASYWIERFARAKAKIDALQVPYFPSGPNSNSIAYTLIKAVGLKPPKYIPDYAPGWGVDLFEWRAEVNRAREMPGRPTPLRDLLRHDLGLPIDPRSIY